LLDRDVGLVAAIGASLRTAWTNPIAVAAFSSIRPKTSDMASRVSNSPAGQRTT